MASNSASVADAHAQLDEMIMSFMKPMALKAVILLDIPQIIATHGNGNPLSLYQIASYISASTQKSPHKEQLFRLLRFLASFGVFSQQIELENGVNEYKYGLTAISKLLVKEGNPYCCAPIVLLAMENIYLDSYHHLHESVLEGCYLFDKAHGMSPWDYLSRNPQANEIFNEGMAAHTKSVMAYVVKNYDAFKNVKTVVDVAGGLGFAISTIINQYPHIQGINLDLPHVIANAPHIPGVKKVAGDMFEQIPCGDVIFMKWILHDWDDEHCVKLLRKSYEAMPEDGKVLIVETVIDESERESSNTRLGLMFDMAMMVYTTGGKERTEQEFTKLFFEAGFKSFTMVKLPSTQALIVVSKS